MPTTVPCLWFDTEAQEAARLYTSVFPRSRITEVSHYGEHGPRPAGTVLTVSFELDGRPYVALNAGPRFPFTEAVSFQIHCADQAEVDHYWDRLSEGGEEGPCGWLKDRFGLSWQVVPTRMIELLTDPDEGRRQGAFETMMTMGRLDIAAIEAGADRGAAGT